jgi:hypothetical protein
MNDKNVKQVTWEVVQVRGEKVKEESMGGINMIEVFYIHV